MSVTLSQHPAAAMPDRPGAGGTGLRVQLTTGGDGAYLAVDLAAPRPVLHARCMFNPHTVAQGAVSIMRGLDEAGAEVWRITFDAVTDALA